MGINGPPSELPLRRLHHLHAAADWIQKNWPDFDLEITCPVTCGAVRENSQCRFNRNILRCPATSHTFCRRWSTAGVWFPRSRVGTDFRDAPASPRCPSRGVTRRRRGSVEEDIPTQEHGNENQLLFAFRLPLFQRWVRENPLCRLNRNILRCQTTSHTFCRRWPKAIAPPRNNCCRSSTTSCGDWPRDSWPPKSRDRRSMPRHSCMRRTCVCSDRPKVMRRSGTGGDISSQPRPRPCDGFWWKMHGEARIKHGGELMALQIARVKPSQTAITHIGWGAITKCGDQGA